MYIGYIFMPLKFCSSFFAAQSWQLKFCHKNWASQKYSDYYQPEPVACKQPVMVLTVVPLWATVVLLRADYGPLLTASNFVMGRASKLQFYRPVKKLKKWTRSVRLLLAQPVSLRSRITGHGPRAGSNHYSLVRSQKYGCENFTYQTLVQT